MNQSGTVVLTNQILEAGYRMVYWDQVGLDKKMVSGGEYVVHLKYRANDETRRCWLIIAIKEDAPHIPTPTEYECPFKDQLPNVNCEHLCTNSSVYSLGDTVAVKFALPVRTHVWLAIQRVPQPNNF
jgi:hypothetical protein